MYTYQEAFASSLDYFGGDELAAKVFLDKYALRDTEGTLMEATPADMHWRIARELARVERNKYGDEAMTEDEIFGYLDGFKKIVPQGSPMYAIGNIEQYSSIGNCFVLSSPLDSYGAILKADQELVQISKRRGGVGVDISHIRPAGTRTANAARSSTGIVPFMDRFSSSIREVGQDGRRGALLVSCSVHHPQILDFITAKQDQTKVTGANISVRLSDEFLQAVKDGVDYEQRWPVDSENPTIHKKVDARSIWKKVIELAHATAEPGLLFWDTIKRESPADCYDDFQTVSTNPCCTSTYGSYYVTTNRGLVEIKEVTRDDLVWIDDEQVWAKTEGYSLQGTAMTHKVTLSNGDNFIVTENHKFQTLTGKRNGTKVKFTERHETKVSDLKPGDLIACSVHEPGEDAFGTLGTYEEGLVLGWMTGDGCLSYHSYDATYPSMILDFWQQEFDVADQLYAVMQNWGYDCNLQKKKNNGSKRIRNSCFVEDFTNKYKRNIWKFKEGHNPFLYSATKDFLIGYLSAYFSADGTVGFQETNKNYNIQLASIDRERIDQIRIILTLFGVKSSVGIGKKAGTTVINKLTYNTKELYRLTITGIDNMKRFYDRVGFVAEEKSSKLRECLEHARDRAGKSAHFTKVKSVEPYEEQEVGCLVVPGYRRFSLNGIISYNSELPLSSNDACRLLLLNLYGYVVNPYTPESYFDYDEFYRDAQVAQRFMDDITDLELEAIDRILDKVSRDPESDEIKQVELDLWRRIRKSCENGRRTGTGITALGDTLAAIGIQYGSDESIEVTEKIYKTLKLGCYRSSVDMAKKLGPFPVWDFEKEKGNPFLLRIADDDPQLYEDMKQYGRRNISLLTTAPAGSVSIMTQTSSGIEPVFMLNYTRRKKINPSDAGTRVDFVDQNGDQWQEFTVYHPKYKTWMDITGKSKVEDSPYYQSCAEEISWPQRVTLQALANRHLDHSISSTLNIPEEATVEQVAEIYETAWEAGCKGITVYRKNCRTGVLIETGNTKAEVPEKLTKTKAPKRPKSLPCDIHRSSVDGSKFFMVVSLLDGDPYEVIAGEASLPRRQMTTGYCVKAKKGVYRLDNEEGETLLENAIDHCTDDQEALLRMVSTSLRHGAEIRFVVEQLEKTRGSLYSFAKMLARNLKKYIPDQTPVSGAVCEACQSSNIVRQEGCMTCLGCGASKCG